jgi:hypothetical protein
LPLLQVCPVGHWALAVQVQAPVRPSLVQVRFEAQLSPQPPQFELLLVRLVQVLPQQTWPPSVVQRR